MSGIFYINQKIHRNNKEYIEKSHILASIKSTSFPIGFPNRVRFESFVTFNQPSIPQIWRIRRLVSYLWHHDDGDLLSQLIRIPAVAVCRSISKFPKTSADRGSFAWVQNTICQNYACPPDPGSRQSWDMYDLVVSVWDTCVSWWWGLFLEGSCGNSLKGVFCSDRSV